MEYSLVPSLPAASLTELTALLDALQGVSKGFQVDIVDGVFAPHTSWPFTEAEPLSELTKLKPYADSYELEIDCMVMHPEQYLDTFVEVGFSRAVIHYGSTKEYDAIFLHAQKHGYKLGIAGTNDVAASDLLSVFPQVDFVQVMGIEHVGAQGQPFDERTLETVAEIRNKRPDLEIAIDGSVNAETIPRLVAAGANRFAPGSAITRAAAPKDAYRELLQLIEPN